MALLKVENLKKTYVSKLSTNKVEALKDINFQIEDGEYVAIMGESGSGKTTLLNILAGLDQPTAGSIRLNDVSMTEIPDKELSAFRRQHSGYVFQDFNLINTFSNRDNIYFPLVLAKEKVKVMEEKLKPIAQQLGIEEILDKYPYEVSGGQKQRIAIARAVITNPSLILADEPTGALDSRSSEEVLKVFQKLNRAGQTIAMVTHSTTAASNANRVLFIKDGKVFNDIRRENKTDNQMYEAITMELSKLVNGR